MKITLVHPPALMAKDNYSTISQPPLGLVYLAAYVRRQDHQVQIVDAVGEALDVFRPWKENRKFVMQGLSFSEIAERIDTDTRLIGFTCNFSHAWPMVRELIRFIHRAFSHIPIIAGGEHVTAMYDAILNENCGLRLCILGEGEETLAQLLSSFITNTDYRYVAGIAYKDEATGEIIRTVPQSRIRDIDQIPWPAWDLIDPMRYLETKVFIGPSVGRTMPMLATRGCPFRCTFCSAHNMWGSLWKARSVKDVVDEMEHYILTYGANDFQFMDLTAIVKKQWIVDFCKEIQRRSLNITWQIPVGTRSEGIDRNVIDLLIASGCRYIQYAPESGSLRMLKAMKKRANLDHMEKSVLNSVSAGMIVSVLFVVGFPEENWSDIRQTFRLIRRLAVKGVHEIAVSTLTPLPGTQIFRDLLKEGVITLDDNYLYWMSGATSLTTAKSWNPRFSNRMLLIIKLGGLLQFYTISYFLHPKHLLRVFRNLISGVQESKVDRVLVEMIEKIKMGWSLKADAAKNPHLHE